MKGSVINDIKAASYNLYKIAHADSKYFATSPGVGEGYFDFCLLQGLRLLFWVQNFEFRYLFGCRGFINYFYGYANFSRYFWGMPFSTGIFLGCQFKNVILWCFFLYIKYSNSFVFA